MLKFWKVKPIDALFFRDQRPLLAGVDNVGRLRFPPNASHFLGALRTRAFEEGGRNVSGFLFNIRLLWLSFLANEEPVFPAPITSGLRKTSLDKSVFEASTSSGDSKNLFVKPGDSPQFLSLSGREVPEEELWQEELKVGITLAGRTTERGYFYRITMARLKEEVAFLVGAIIPDEMEKAFPKKFVTKLGGRGKLAVWEEWEGWAALEGSKEKPKTWLVLSPVPVLNEKGQWVCEGKGVGVSSIVSAGADYLSGWDVRARKPKPGRASLRPGSVLKVKDNVSWAKKVEIDGRTLWVADAYLLKEEKEWLLAEPKGEEICLQREYQCEEPLEPAPGIIFGGLGI